MKDLSLMKKRIIKMEDEPVCPDCGSDHIVDDYGYDDEGDNPNLEISDSLEYVCMECGFVWNKS